MRQDRLVPPSLIAAILIIPLLIVFFFPPGSLGKKTTMIYVPGDVLTHVSTGKKLTVLSINCQLKNQRRGRCAVEARSHDNLTISFYHPDEVK